jgi:hypothetical protein
MPKLNVSYAAKLIDLYGDSQGLPKVEGCYRQATFKSYAITKYVNEVLKLFSKLMV